MRWEGGPDKDPPPGGTSDLKGLFKLVGKRRGVTSSRLPGEGHESDRPPGSLYAPSHAGHNSGPGGGELTPPEITTM